jgi:hypothetical protein
MNVVDSRNFTSPEYIIVFGSGQGRDIYTDCAGPYCQVTLYRTYASSLLHREPDIFH